MDLVLIGLILSAVAPVGTTTTYYFCIVFVKRNGGMMLSFKGAEISFHLLVLRKSRFKPKIIRYRIVNLLVIFFWNIVKTM